MSKQFASGPSVDQVQAAYWQGPVTRGEAQQVFDGYAAEFAIVQSKFSILTAFLFEKLNVTEEELKAFVAKTQAQQAEAQAASPQPEPEKTSSLIIP
jgi:ribosomal protein L9